jgi:hypothetical protein
MNQQHQKRPKPKRIESEMSLPATDLHPTTVCSDIYYQSHGGDARTYVPSDAPLGRRHALAARHSREVDLVHGEAEGLARGHGHDGFYMLDSSPAISAAANRSVFNQKAEGYELNALRGHTDDLFRTRSKAPAPRIGLTLKPCESYQTTNHSCKKTRSTVIDGRNPISGESYLPQISSVSFRLQKAIQFHSV